MEVGLFDAFSMVSLRIGKTKESLFEEFAGASQQDILSPNPGDSTRGAMPLNVLFLVPETERNVLVTVRV